MSEGYFVLPLPVIESLREKIRRIEAAAKRAAQVLPFGLPGIDLRLPGGGLAMGALHEVAGGGNGAIDGAAAALFTAGIAARTKGQILCCVRLTDLSVQLSRIGERAAPFPLPRGRGDEAKSGGGPDPSEALGRKPRDIYIPDRHIDTIKMKTRDFH